MSSFPSTGSVSSPAIRGLSGSGLIAPWHPARLREVAGVEVGISCQLSVVSCRVSGVGCRVSGVRGKQVFPTDRHVRDWTCWCLPDPHATAALVHPRASREPGFELWFKPWHWPQHQPSPCRSAAISVRRRPSRSIDVSHASKNPSATGVRGSREQGTRELGTRDKGIRERTSDFFVGSAGVSIGYPRRACRDFGC